MKARIAKVEKGLTIQIFKVVKKTTALTVARPLGNPRPANHTSWRPIIAESPNAGSLLNKTEELTGVDHQKNWDIIGVTETWLHDGIRDDEI